MADNNNLMVYNYPLSKVVINYSFLYLVYFVAAYAMRKVFRTTDYLISTGGDEFVAILPGCSASKASTLEKKLQDTVRENPLKKMEVNISVSTGLAISNENESLQDVIMRADEELYETKRQRV
ncbi:GGDEF domain-containing protein [Vibrio campbellii]|uniref:GGDEF domain-containing protein n=1 Tax=Vibrio campbellii TaxID=680 RepID=UPI0038CD89F4